MGWARALASAQKLATEWALLLDTLSGSEWVQPLVLPWDSESGLLSAPAWVAQLVAAQRVQAQAAAEAGWVAYPETARLAQRRMGQVLEVLRQRLHAPRRPGRLE